MASAAAGAAAGAASRGGPAIESPEAAQPALSDDDKAKAEAAAATERKSGSGRFVRYLGPRTNTGTKRRITPAHWNSVGIPATHAHEWSLANDFKLPESAFTQQQLDQLFNVDDQFEMVDAHGNRIKR